MNTPQAARGDCAVRMSSRRAARRSRCDLDSRALYYAPAPSAEQLPTVSLGEDKDVAPNGSQDDPTLGLGGLS